MREYARSEIDSNRRVLIALICDGCGARTKPPISKDSGWVNQGYYHGPGTEIHQWEYCDSCAGGNNVR